ncbi:hypothetical protein GCM10011352_10450 [Marinobacterium zhoushanense]|uniref:DUF2726 domain-containing protein n=1 Tax=Marinobacterium zhoushanense TaxID=1679163 RepID=A0ABQ1K7Y1_9GAMM|nr:DUF2726 domain-containing protein [Marinobacterium zhoushanense]GGB86459.1 hypothetical protein GCM10011352_10450 [Marinobacterium zhoushanense]
MEWIIPLVVVLFVFVLIAQKRNAGASNQDTGDYRYRQRKTLFTAAERSFLGVLDSIIDPQQHRIFGKVRVADLIEPERSHNSKRNRSQWQKAFNRISAKHFDFVICKADDLTPVCAIELDDASHKQSKRQQRDELLEKVCGQVGLALVRVPAQRGYQVPEVKILLSPHIFSGLESKMEEPVQKQKMDCKPNGIRI